MGEPPAPTGPSFDRVSNHQLLRRLGEILRDGRNLEAELLAHLGEVEARQLHLAEGYDSMYRYCTEALGFSEAVAYDRIRVARAAREFPMILEALRAGVLHPAGARILAPHLTEDNHAEVLCLASGKSSRQLREIAADLAPKPDVSSGVTELRGAGSPAGPVASSGSASLRRPPTRPRSDFDPEPLGQERYRIQFTVSQGFCDKLSEAQSLLRHQIPDRRLARIFDRALTLLLEDTRRKKFGQISRPPRRTRKDRIGPLSRHIPAEIKRAVVLRDKGACAFRADSGRVCGSREFLEFHHLDPWATSNLHSIDNVELRCHAHNQYEEFRRSTNPESSRLRPDAPTRNVTRRNSASHRPTAKPPTSQPG